ncbi:hypothetical protein OC845_004318 [Tilletia horrida]|nr:hypothetical protein OC845_004318 [Tilletia horrida]
MVRRFSNTLVAFAAILSVAVHTLLSPTQLHSFPPSNGELPNVYSICAPPESRPSGFLSQLPWTSTTLEIGPSHIHTLSGERDDLATVSCLRIENGRVAAHQTQEEAQALCQSDPLIQIWTRKNSPCRIYQVPKGSAVLPGLHDAHGHVLDLGWSRTAADLVGSESVAEIISRLEDYVRSSPEHLADESRWVEGLGWDQSKFKPPIFPRASDFATSELLRARNLALRRIDVHALWLSPAALRQVTQLPDFPAPRVDVPGGLVVRDDSTKEPTGILIDNAMNFAYRAMPRVSDAQRQVQLEAAAKSILSVGLTNVGDAAVDRESIAFLKRAAESGRLPFRLYAFLACPPENRTCEPPQQLINYADRLTVRTVKLFADGALGSWGSAMLEPYNDHKGERGLLLIPEHEIKPLTQTWVERGWQVATHAIGDRANKLVLDAYESLVARSDNERDLRLRVEHAQVMRVEDITRFGELGVIASMQPTHCTSDMGYVETRIGHDRAKGAYAWKSLLNANASLAFGSDFPVEDPSPFHGIYSAVTRLDASGNSPAGSGGWFPEERVSRLEALLGFTVDAAYAQFEEGRRGGTLAVGAAADFIVIDRDIMDEDRVSPAQLRETKVLATVIDSRIAWQSSNV